MGFGITCHDVFATNLRDAIDAAQVNNRNIKLEQIRLNSVKTEKTRAIAEFLLNVSANASYGQRNSYFTKGNLMIAQLSKRPKR